MNDLEELLSSHLAQAAAAADPTPPERSSVLATVATRRRRRRAGYGAAVAAVTVLIAGVALAGLDDSGGGREDDPVMEGGDDDPTGTTTPSTAPPGTADQTTSTSTSTSTTPSPPPTAEGLVLAADGLGSIDFGLSHQETVARVTEELGEPIADSGVTPFACELPECDPPATGLACPAMTVSRTVDWPGLSLLFYGDTADTMTWFGWTAGAGAQPRSMAGADTDDSLAVWREAHGDDLTTSMFQPMDDGRWVELVRVRTDGGEVVGFTNVGAPPDRIDSLTAGMSCVGGDY